MNTRITDSPFAGVVGQWQCDFEADLAQLFPPTSFRLTTTAHYATFFYHRNRKQSTGTWLKQHNFHIFLHERVERAHVESVEGDARIVEVQRMVAFQIFVHVNHCNKNIND